MIESLESRSLMSASFATMTGTAMLSTSPSVPSVTMSRSDIGAKLAVQLNEANNTVLAPALPPPPPPPNTIGVVVK